MSDIWYFTSPERMEGNKAHSVADKPRQTSFVIVRIPIHRLAIINNGGAWMILGTVAFFCLIDWILT